MTGDELPKNDHVIRYIKPTLIDKGIVRGAAFVARQSEYGISVNWLEVFQCINPIDQIHEIRRLFRLNTARNGKFAKLNVGDTKLNVSLKTQHHGKFSSLKIIHDPLDCDGEHSADPSHAQITEIPPSESDDALLIGDLIAESIIYPLYPAKIQN